MPAGSVEGKLKYLKFEKSNQVKQVFISSKGSVEIERDILYINNKKYNFFETGFAKIAWYFLPIVFLCIILLAETDPFRLFMRTVLFSLLSLNNLPTLYRLLFKTSFSKRIPLSKIELAETAESKDGLEVEMILRLSNGRMRTILFRKLENQFEPLIAALPQSPSTATLA